LHHEAEMADLYEYNLQICGEETLPKRFTHSSACLANLLVCVYFSSVFEGF